MFCRNNKLVGTDNEYPCTGEAVYLRISALTSENFNFLCDSNSYKSTRLLQQERGEFAPLLPLSILLSGENRTVSDLRIVGCRRFCGPAVQIKTELLHFVSVALLLVATHAQVKVIAHGTVEARLHALLAVVAVVHKLVLALETNRLGQCQILSLFADSQIT